MKKYLNCLNITRSLFISLIFLSYHSKAQVSYYPHHISLQYSFFSSLFDESIYNEKYFNIQTNRVLGPVGISYQFSKSERIRVGASVSYGIKNSTTTEYNNSNSTVVAYIYETTNEAIFFSSEVIYVYGIKYKIRPYGKLACAFVVNNITKEYSYPKAETNSLNSKDILIQFSPIGVEYGNEICGFAEFGYGPQGRLLTGIRRRF